jgi:DNA-binding NarL/FixJ family response regulator
VQVLLADRFRVTRDVLGALLDGESGIEVIAQASDLAALRVGLRRQPDVLAIDLALFRGTPIEELRRLHAEWPRIAIVALTMEINQAFAEHALQAGATAVVLKYMAEEELSEAIRLAAPGDAWVSPGATPGRAEQSRLGFCP